MKKHILPFISLSIFTAFFIWGCNEDNGDIPYAGPARVDISASAVTETEATIVYEPNMYTVKYIYAIGTEDDFTAFSERKLAGIVEQNTNEAVTVKYKDLDDLTDYAFFAMGVNADGVWSQVATLPLRTLQDFEINVTATIVTAHEITIRVENGYQIGYYEYALARPGDEEGFANGTLDTVKEKREVVDYSEQFTSLREITDYVFLARFYDRKGTMVKYLELPVKTLKKGSYPDVTLDHYKNTAVEMRLKITPNEHVGKVGLVLGDRDFNTIAIENENYNMLSLFKFYERAGVIDIRSTVTNGEHGEEYPADAITFEYYLAMIAEYEYTSYIVVYDKEGEPYNWIKYDFSPPLLYIREAGIESLLVAADSPTMATASLTRTETTTGIMYNFADQDAYDEFQSDPYFFIDTFLNYYYDDQYDELGNRIRPYDTFFRLFNDGEYEHEFKNDTPLTPSTRFYAVVAAFNDNGFNGFNTNTWIRPIVMPAASGAPAGSPVGANYANTARMINNIKASRFMTLDDGTRVLRSVK